MDFDYTDHTANGGIPLSQPWERQAMKEVCDIAHYLAHGLFLNQSDFADRLRQSADHFEPELAEALPTNLLDLSQQRERAIAQLSRLKPDQQLIVIHLIDNFITDILAGDEQTTRLNESN